MCVVVLLYWSKMKPVEDGSANIGDDGRDAILGTYVPKNWESMTTEHQQKPEAQSTRWRSSRQSANVREGDGNGVVAVFLMEWSGGCVSLLCLPSNQLGQKRHKIPSVLLNCGCSSSLKTSDGGRRSISVEEEDEGRGGKEVAILISF